MRMKKVIVMLFASAFMVLQLSGCSDASKPEVKTTVDEGNGSADTVSPEDDSDASKSDVGANADRGEGSADIVTSEDGLAGTGVIVDGLGVDGELEDWETEEAITAAEEAQKAAEEDKKTSKEEQKTSGESEYFTDEMIDEIVNSIVGGDGSGDNDGGSDTPTESKNPNAVDGSLELPPSNFGHSGNDGIEGMGL